MQLLSFEVAEVKRGRTVEAELLQQVSEFRQEVSQLRNELDARAPRIEE